MRSSSRAVSFAAVAALALSSPQVALADECEVCVWGICSPTPGVPCGIATDCSYVGVCGLSRGECNAVFKGADTLCRPSTGPCDRAEYCTGYSTSCPGNSYQPSSLMCRAANGACDRAEYCTGSSALCPADSYQPSTTVCRAANGACDRAEYCTGGSTACPADSYQPSTTVCRAANGACDRAEYCTGSSTACPADSYQPSTTVCRAANGACDRAENCTGASAACPADGFLPSTTVCRPANGVCDRAESCTGASAACPTDGFQPSSFVCRPANGVCDQAESCTGTGSGCPADSFAPSTTVCRAAGGQCDTAETCPGTGTACPSDARAGDGTSCENVSACVAGGSCAAGVCLGGTSEITFQPATVTLTPSVVTSVAIRHTGSGSAIQLTGATTDPASEFEVVAHPAWPVLLASGQETAVGVKLAATAVGSYTGALVVSAATCSDLSVELAGNIAAPPPPPSKKSSGGCGHGPAGLLGLLAPLALVAATRRRGAGRSPPRTLD